MKCVRFESVLAKLMERVRSYKLDWVLDRVVNFFELGKIQWASLGICFIRPRMWITCFGA